MKVAAPTTFQAALLGRALEATKYTEQRKALWRAVFKQAAQTVKAYKLSWPAEDLVSYWLDIQPEAEEKNRIQLDDLQTGFLTISQESGAVVVPLDSLEEYGDTWQEAPEDTREARLLAGLTWDRDPHPVTERAHLPRWCDGTSDPPEDEHLEPAFLGFEGLKPSEAKTPRALYYQTKRLKARL
jgi:hypothetical protein